MDAITDCAVDGCAKARARRSKLCYGHRSARARETRQARLDAGDLTLACTVAGCGRLKENALHCHGHVAAAKRGGPLQPFHETPEERFFAKVRKLPSGHWIWTGATASEGRYGAFAFGGRVRPAHVAAWLMFRGELPAGTEDIDHLCRKTLCVNPDHLEPKTHRANVLAGDAPSAINAAKTHCDHGHAFTEANTYHRKAGGRDCRTCMRERTREAQRRYRARKKAAAAAA